MQEAGTARNGDPSHDAFREGGSPDAGARILPLSRIPEQPQSVLPRLRHPRPSLRQRVLTILLTVTAVVVVALVLLTAALWQGQERIVWQPPATRVPDPAGVRRLEFVADDSQPLYAYVVGDAGRGRETLLVFHGNADLAAWLVPWAQETARRTGTVVVLPEYRGYGGLAGALDAEGESPRALVLQSPFTSVRDMARLLAPALLLWDAIARVHFDTETRVRALRAPVWVSHGTRDLIIPSRMGQRVYAAAAHKGELLLVPGAGHNDVPEAGGEAYWQWLARALGRAAARRAAAD